MRGLWRGSGGGACWGSVGLGFGVYGGLGLGWGWGWRCWHWWRRVGWGGKGCGDCFLWGWALAWALLGQVRSILNGAVALSGRPQILWSVSAVRQMESQACLGCKGAPLAATGFWSENSVLSDPDVAISQNGARRLTDPNMVGQCSENAAFRATSPSNLYPSKWSTTAETCSAAEMNPELAVYCHP